MITNDLTNLTSDQLRRALQIREQIEALQHELGAVMGGGFSAPASSAPIVSTPRTDGRRHMSASARAAISRAQKARWALYRKDKPAVAATTGTKPKRKLSAAGRAAISAALKARWAAAKASNRNAL